MSRYIDADKLVEDIHDRKDSANGPEMLMIIFDEMCNFAASCVENAPTADVVEVKHGKWEKHGMDVAEHPLRCSECSWGNHHIANRYVMEMDYCPNCGARMDELDGESE